MYKNNDGKNNGRVVVVTGSTKGIGKSIAEEFAINGYTVVLNARIQMNCQRLLMKFQAKPKLEMIQ